MTFIRIAAVTLVLSSALACGKSTSTDPTTTGASANAAAAAGGITGSCNVRKVASTCSEDTEKSDPMGLSKSLCSALKGVWTPGKCPQDALVGTCADKDGSTTYYYLDGDAPSDADSAKAACETLSEGKFTLIAKPPAPAAASATATAAPKPTPATAPKPAGSGKKH